MHPLDRPGANRPSVWDQKVHAPTAADLWLGFAAFVGFFAMCALGAFIVCAWWGLI